MTLQVCYCLTTEVEQAGLLPKYEGLLSADELARYARFKAREPQVEYLVGRALLRTVLAARVSADPRSLVFETTALGQPYLVASSGFSGPRFSLSHSYGLVACAVGWSSAIGLDVECISRTSSIEEIARELFSVEERSDLASAPTPEEKRTRFFQYWTLKEAYGKARGLGLAAALEQVTFRLHGGRVAEVSLAGAPSGEPTSWHAELLELVPTHCAALITSRGPARPVVTPTRFTPLAERASGRAR